MCYGSLDKPYLIKKKFHFSDITNVQTGINFYRIVISAYSFYLSDAKNVS